MGTWRCPGVDRRLLVLLLTLLALCGAAPARSQAAGEDFLIITVGEGQTLRSIAREYLNDPDLWDEILRVNDLGSVVEVKPGMELKLPRTQVSLANQALADSRQAIQQASAQGAKVFSAQLLEDAVGLHNRALERRKASDWSGCLDFANRSRRQAQQALERTRRARDSAGQAVLSGRAGTVERRAASDSVWHEAALGAVLAEQEKVRTLSASQAEILFLDESRLRLGANSQAVIQRMRVDRLSSRQEASVSLLEGDVYALLGSSAKTRKFDVAVAGVTTETRSTDFWMSRSGTTTKIANFDQAEMVVSSAGTSVTLGMNQGALVRDRAAPVKRDLLRAPVLRAPVDNFTVFTDRVELAWEPLAGAVRYRFDLAADLSFRSLMLNRTDALATGSAGAAGEGGSFHMWQVTEANQLEWAIPSQRVEDGVYYWRVAGIDGLGFPGAASEVRRIEVRRAVGAPYLTVIRPRDGEILRSGPVRVEGVVATTAALTVDGAAVQVREDGSFDLEVGCVEGLNTVVVAATDESGRVTRRERSFFLVPDRPARIEFDPTMVAVGPGAFACREPVFLLKGKTTPGATVEVISVGSGLSSTALACCGAEGGDGEAAAHDGSEPDGEFALGLPLEADLNQFVVRVTAPSGYVTEQQLAVTRDLAPPSIEVPSPPPAVLREPTFHLRARVDGATLVELDGRSVSTREGWLDEVVDLRPGVNRLEIDAADRVGNRSHWERLVRLDQEPPRVESVELSPTTAASGDTVVIAVRVADDSTVKRSAAFSLRIGSWSHSGAMILDRPRRTYRVLVPVPWAVSGRVELRHVILEDEVGNRQVHRP